MDRANLRFGLVMPQEGKTCEQILSAAREAEKVGFDSVWVYDHLFMSPTRSYPECWVILSALAIGTQRLRLGPLVLNNLLRNPMLVAKMGATLDQISHGRLELGLGAGWYNEECDASGIKFPSFTERAARLAEAVEIILRLWKARGRPVSFEGRYYAIKEATCSPATYSTPYPHVFLGGRGVSTLRIAAKHMLGINVDQDWGMGLAEVQRTLIALNQLCQAEGTNPERIRKSLCVRLFVGSSESDIQKQLTSWKADMTSRQSLVNRVKRGSLRLVRSALGIRPLKSVPPTSQIIGSPENCVSQLLEYCELGVTHFYIKLYDFTDIDLLQLVADQIIKPMKG